VELINVELINAELTFADVLRRFCEIYFCGYNIKTIFLMLYIHMFFQIKLTIER